MATGIRHQPENGYHSEPAQPSPGESLKRRELMRLPRSLSAVETSGFGLTGLANWFTIATAIQAGMGPSAIFVWLPGILMGIMLNLQVKRIGEYFPNMAGGTPNYTARMLKNYPGLGSYAAIGYFLSWVSTLPISAIVLTQLIKVNLNSLGFSCPETLLNITFTLLPFILTFSGTRALSILHAFFVLPTVGVLSVFSIHGLIWLAFSPNSPGFFPAIWPEFTFIDWAKWFYFATYIFYCCDSAASFVADSRNPTKTLQFLKISALGMLPVILGGSWVLMRLATAPGLKDDVFLNVLAACQVLWGPWVPTLVTFLVVASCLLSCATIVSNCPRMLYQLAVDGHISPTFAVVSRRGVFGFGLVFVLVLSLICLAWGNVPRLVAITNVGLVVCLMMFHLSLWLRRDQPEVRWPGWSLGFFVVDAVVLVVGGLAWGWQDFIIGLFFPLGVLAVEAGISRIAFAPFHPSWWIRLYRNTSKSKMPDFVAFQVVILILLIVSAVSVGWIFGFKLYANSTVGLNLFVVLLVTVAFIGVAVACWTSLPQVVSMDEAREGAEQLFIIALDAIVVLDENGVIRQTNPAAESVFGIKARGLIGSHLNKLLPGLGVQPEQWLSRSEQTFNFYDRSARILEVAISDRFSQGASLSNQDLQQYVAIVRDITDRKQAQQALQKANEELEIKVEERTSELTHTVEQLQNEIEERQRIEENLRAMQNQIIVQEKLASLGSLTAGIAHEIRNPLNFVNNFSEVSAELTEELLQEIENQTERLEPDSREYITELLTDLKANLQKINQHGQRADRIVGNMLLHSRGQRGHWEATNINSLLEEYVNLAYHGMRAKEAAFNMIIASDYDSDIGKVEVVPQDISRVFLNIINNACYAAHKKKQETGEEFSPQLDVRTRNLGSAIEIRIRDNGPGIDPDIFDKIFNPFFTTKPAGEGTGLGLSISHDIIVQQHRGEIKVETEAGNYTEFIITLPKKIAEVKEFKK
ncbi:ATP-binding protein [Microcoleus sp. LAD1_D3]|uniref:ATP-binding protein n=1 Tax=Microcoleus sp. LAD1_D3 TaxID=2819365 RepID=UPI002FD12CAE